MRRMVSMVLVSSLLFMLVVVGEPTTASAESNQSEAVIELHKLPQASKAKIIDILKRCKNGNMSKASMLSSNKVPIRALLNLCKVDAEEAFPGAEGFGQNTRGAYALFQETKKIADLPIIMKVTNLDNSGE